jgi:hypothetical protein
VYKKLALQRPGSNAETMPNTLPVLLLPLIGIVLIQAHFTAAAKPFRAQTAAKALAAIQPFQAQHGVFLALNHINTTDGSNTQIANFSGGFDPQVQGCTHNSESNTFSFFNGF